ncbi:tripartite tricarboxylate transporter substrate binding protein [Paracraurococcus lichenis]|uniref:Tripartite tricarboxylate transporter substrate binding protein n=1 Tax=Paracraurococcus lichenis TaxID=3064888 RepID=A0ABT9E5L4_9PROT|nr:tripartite tricarboxylate transporter substrate binding protein [Paracraurococcus sp. LOR1-02]MDO9711467.1 tripartite tricarboxylate transporter substrate binding protein [Paracraurococcus sp. LOR1-02]
MPLFRRRHLALLPALLTPPGLARAEDRFPSRSLRLVVPWPPGGGVDVLARLLQPALGAQLGQTVVIENIGGAAGRIGTQAAARATADGHTLLLANDTFAATEALAAPGAPALRHAFAPVSLAATAAQGVFTHPRSGLRSIRDFAEALRRRPGGLNIGIPGIGSSQHLTSELLLRAAGNLRAEHVPYRGGGPLLQDLLAGTIDAAVVTFAAAAQQATNGDLVALAVTSEARTPAFPAVPTAAESIAPGFVQPTWLGFFAPLGTPAAAIARLHAATLAALADAGVQERLRALGFEPAGLDGEQFGALFARTIATFSDIVAERGIVAES